VHTVVAKDDSENNTSEVARRAYETGEDTFEIYQRQYRMREGRIDLPLACG
jgi:hypothetical protein